MNYNSGAFLQKLLCLVKYGISNAHPDFKSFTYSILQLEICHYKSYLSTLKVLECKISDFSSTISGHSHLIHIDFLFHIL